MAQLIRANLGIEFFQVDQGGWDHHANILNNIPIYAGQLEDSFDDAAPIERWFRAGGFGRLSGLAPDQLSGRHIGLASLAALVLLIVWLATKGTSGDNQFGPDPLIDETVF